jgi:hypothetical protein
MQIARKLLLTAEILQASIRDDGEWASLLSQDTANQPGGYNELIEMINGLRIAGTSFASGKIHIPDHSFIKSIPWAQGEDSRMRGRHASADIIMPQLERLSDIMLTAWVPNKRQRESGYHSNATRRPYLFQQDNKEAVETFMNLPRGQWDSCALDSLLQILGRQVMMSQVPTLVGT